ncbi:class I tRNA ligase family protein, partial [Candidatus Peregrinibacteria bacterium]|nr:class I tRNA ligase family protein [Candidatus Peregrinibacteria bacterium]
MRSDNSNYDAAKVEKKWQEKWARMSSRAGSGKAKKKYYNLVMFPYPSGDKLHIGHWYNFAPADSHGRFMRMHGHDVFEPMGFDSFGLPAENYAIKTGVHPTKSIKKNVEKMVEQ